MSSESADASEDYQRLLETRGITCSMSRRGHCYDNAVMEAFFASVKSELADPYDSGGEAKLALFDAAPASRRRHAARRTSGAACGGRPGDARRVQSAVPLIEAAWSMGVPHHAPCKMARLVDFRPRLIRDVEHRSSVHERLGIEGTKRPNII